MRVCLARGRGEARRPACGSDSVSPERPSRVPRGGAAFPCSSVHDTAVYRARAHTHTRVRVYTGRTAYTWIYVAVHARLGQAHVHAWNRGKVRVRARGTRACAAIHTPVPLGEGHTPISGDRGDRDSSTTRVCLSKPARVSKVHSAGYEGCDSFLPSEEREKRERRPRVEFRVEFRTKVRRLRDYGILES